MQHGKTKEGRKSRKEGDVRHEQHAKKEFRGQIYIQQHQETTETAYYS